jgi:hypothetical protein
MPFKTLHGIIASAMFLLMPFALTAQEATETPADTLKKEDSQNIKLPIFSISADDLDANSGSQDVATLLQSSRDVYTAAAGFNFGQARFRMRGYSSENTIVMINGIRVNDMESGFPVWAAWGGLNDVTRYMDLRAGIASGRSTFGGINGYANIETRASSFRKGHRISYAASNRTYTHRAMYTYSTGLRKDNWAFTFSGSRRFANEGYVEGTFFDGYSYFFSAEKILNKKHSIGFTGFGAPMTQGTSSGAVQEIYDLSANNYYNPNWGFQNGVKRNSRVTSTHRPMSIFTHNWKISEKTTLASSLFNSFGTNSFTTLNWYDARDPRPDYYRYLPSYWLENDNMLNQTTQAWTNDINRRQVDWDHLYFANSKNMYSVVNANGITGNTVVGNRSKYALEEHRLSQNLWGLNVLLNSAVKENIFVSGGFNASKFSGNRYKVMNDLLGGDFWIDVDQFAERDFDDANVAHNDISTPNKVIKVGDRFGYDYTANIEKYEGFGQVEYSKGRFDFFGGLQASQDVYWRTGNMQNGRFPENSSGDSKKQSFFNYGAKGGITYRITGRHALEAKAQYQTRAPFFRNAYISPRTRNTTLTDNLQNEQIKTGELSYIIRHPNIRGRLTGYYTEINNQNWLRNFFHDEFRTFVNYAMTGVNHLHYGIEAGAEIKVSPTLNITLAATKSENLWNSRPLATITRDNDSEVLATDRIVYLKNYKIGGMPQTAATAGFRYNAKKYWFVGANINYFNDIYVEVNPDRRTAEAVEKFITSDPQWNQIVNQDKLNDAYTVDVFFGKSWRVKRKYYLNLNANINNLLNTNTFATGGFEQMRYDSDQIEKFPPKFFYMWGRTFFIMASVSF